MQPTDFDRKLIETLREVVRGNEDYVYRTPEVVPEYFYQNTHKIQCYYEDGLGKPSCVFGHVAHRLGLFVHEGQSIASLAEAWGASPIVVRALQECQNAQDVGLFWGKALANCEQVLEQYGVVI